MGDISDMHLDQWFDEVEYGLWHPLHEERGYRQVRRNQPKCKHCGAGGLHWGETDRGWRLFDRKGEMHSCLPTRQQTADEMFPD